MCGVFCVEERGRRSCPGRGQGLQDCRNDRLSGVEGKTRGPPGATNLAVLRQAGGSSARPPRSSRSASRSPSGTGGLLLDFAEKATGSGGARQVAPKKGFSTIRVTQRGRGRVMWAQSGRRAQAVGYRSSLDRAASRSGPARYVPGVRPGRAALPRKRSGSPMARSTRYPAAWTRLTPAFTAMLRSPARAEAASTNGRRGVAPTGAATPTCFRLDERTHGHRFATAQGDTVSVTRIKRRKARSKALLAALNEPPSPGTARTSPTRRHKKPRVSGVPCHR